MLVVGIEARVFTGPSLGDEGLGLEEVLWVLVHGELLAGYGGLGEVLLAKVGFVEILRNSRLQGSIVRKPQHLEEGQGKVDR
jgi:hypothetical protein